jgi:hypothetical protein
MPGDKKMGLDDPFFVDLLIKWVIIYSSKRNG